MSNNDILRSLRYTFDYSDAEMIDIFAAADQTVTRSQVSDWMKKDDDPEFQEMEDVDLAVFLNGLINKNRGRKEGEQAIPETELNNNIIFKKLKIALNLKDEDILEMLESVNKKISKHELSAFFRKKGQTQYRPCLDQILRNFLHGMQLKYRGN